jgi:hypothetical protein
MITDLNRRAAVVVTHEEAERKRRHDRAVCRILLNMALTEEAESNGEGRVPPEE